MDETVLVKLDFIGNLKKSPKTKTVAFEITRIPELSEEDKRILSTRFGYTFTYKLAINSNSPFIPSKTYGENGLHGDDIVIAREKINSLFDEKISCNDLSGLTEFDKINLVFRIMKESFQLMEVTEFESMGLREHIGKEDIHSKLVDSLTCKKLTPQTYIIVVNELLRMIGIEGMRYQLVIDYSLKEELASQSILDGIEPVKVDDDTEKELNSAIEILNKSAEREIRMLKAIQGLIVPEVIIPISETENIILNGRTGTRLESKENALVTNAIIK